MSRVKALKLPLNYMPTWRSKCVLSKPSARDPQRIMQCVVVHGIEIREMHVLCGGFLIREAAAAAAAVKRILTRWPDASSIQLLIILS